MRYGQRIRLNLIFSYLQQQQQLQLSGKLNASARMHNEKR